MSRSCSGVGAAVCREGKSERLAARTDPVESGFSFPAWVSTVPPRLPLPLTLNTQTNPTATSTQPSLLPFREIARQINSNLALPRASRPRLLSL